MLLCLGKNLIPTATHFELIDTFVKVTDEESAHTARTITKSEGMFVGYTSGAAMQAIHQLAEEHLIDKDSKVVVIFPDHGSRYMSKIYSEDWMAEQRIQREARLGRDLLEGGEFTSIIQYAALKAEFATGGIVTKLKAAEFMMNQGREMFLCNGYDLNAAEAYLLNDNQIAGTVFRAYEEEDS